MDLLIRSSGEIQAVYSEELDLGVLGPRSIARASHVEPDETGKWLADLSPVNGRTLGPFTLRSQAIEAEIAWLTEHLLTSTWRTNL